MKKIFLIMSAMALINAKAQVAIGTNALPSNNYVSLEFGTATPNESKGVLLPRVTNEGAVSSAPVGTFIFDAATQKIKLATASAAATATTQHTTWFDYSNGASTPSTSFTNTDGYTDAPLAKVIIGASTTPVDGILILETPNPDALPQAMVLPRVNNYTDIVNPSAGMMVYVKTNKRFAVFNGSQWSFWQPAP